VAVELSGRPETNRAKSIVMRIWTEIKRTLQNVDWPALIGLFGFLTLTYMSATQGHPYFALIILIIGIFFVFLAAYNSYRQKSTELVDRYDERFFVKMKLERKLAAQYLLGQDISNAHLKHVLDFFEAPIGVKTISGQIDSKQVFDYFHHWIILYWQASQNDIDNYCKKDRGAWGSLKKLYDIMIEIEKKELGATWTDEDLIMTKERLKEALEDEANLI
jgi:hypothetical protein